MYGLGDDILDRSLEHHGDSDQGLDRWVLVGAALKLDDRVVVDLGFLGKLVTSQFMLGAKTLDLGRKFGKIIFWSFAHI